METRIPLNNILRFFQKMKWRTKEFTDKIGKVLITFNDSGIMIEHIFPIFETLKDYDRLVRDLILDISKITGKEILDDLISLDRDQEHFRIAVEIVNGRDPEEFMSILHDSGSANSVLSEVVRIFHHRIFYYYTRSR